MIEDSQSPSVAGQKAENRTIADSRTTIIGAAIALKLGILFAFSWHTLFVMDEFWQFGQSKYLLEEFFDSIWPAKAVGYVAFYKLAHLIGWDSTSMLLIGRLQTAALACVTLMLVYHCGRSLGQKRLTAMMVVLVLLGFTNFLERIFRTISEPLALFFAVAALLAVLRGDPDRTARLLLAGILSGLSFLATQKASYFNLALGLGLVADAIGRGNFRTVFWRGSTLLAGWMVPLVVYCLIFGGFGAVKVAENLIFGPLEVAVHGGEAYEGLQSFVMQTLGRNFILYLFCFAGMALAASRFPTLSSPERIALVHALVMTVLIFCHNQPWPYVFLMVLPFIALWSTYCIGEVPRGFHRLSKYWIVLVLGILLSFSMNFAYFRYENHHQLDLISRAERVLGEKQTYFDGTGMLPNRKESPYVWLDRATIVRTLAQGRDSKTYDQLIEHPPKIILWNYRLTAIDPLIGSFVRDSYVNVGSNLLVLGRRLSPGQVSRFTIVQSGVYHLYSMDGTAVSDPVLVNGSLKSSPIRMGLGVVSLKLPEGSKSALLLPRGRYEGIVTDRPNELLFQGVYD